MKTVDFVLLLIHAANGKVEGRTVLQKMAYFVALANDFDLDYQPHYYGPFSYKLEHSLSLLADAGYLIETMEVYPSLRQNNFDSRKYIYELTAAGNGKAGKVIKDNFNKAETIKNMVAALKDNFGNSAAPYSIAAKVHYLLMALNKPKNFKEIIEAAGQLNWSINDAQIKQAADGLVKLKLANKR